MGVRVHLAYIRFRVSGLGFWSTCTLHLACGDYGLRFRHREKSHGTEMTWELGLHWAQCFRVQALLGRSGLLTVLNRDS